MQAVGIASGTQAGQLLPLVNVQFSCQDDDGWTVMRKTGNTVTDAFGNEVPETVPVSGWHVNVRYYGSSADALMQGGDPSSPDLFERAPGLLAITELRTGEPMQWVALSDDPVPPGYENSNGVRLYDPSLISTRANVWA